MALNCAYIQNFDPPAGMQDKSCVQYTAKCEIGYSQTNRLLSWEPGKHSADDVNLKRVRHTSDSVHRTI